MVVVALILNPLIVFSMIRRNPYPLVLTALRESGITASFTRSSAANIPVNLALCRTPGLDEEAYAISIPLGATVSMAGAAITITVLTLAAAHTLGISATFQPLSCCRSWRPCRPAARPESPAGRLGFVVSVLQDSAETALNSSTDVVFTAAACEVKAAQAEAVAEATPERLT